MTQVKQGLRPTRDPGLVAIAVFKLFKGVTLIALGLGAFRLANPRTVHHLVNWLLHFSLTTGQHFIDRTIDLLSRLTRGHAAALGLGAILYGSLFTVEGIGLWKGKRWAEYLTVIATSMLIPFEIYELSRRLTLVRVSALAVNVAAVIYLVYRLRHPRVASEASRSSGSRGSECLKVFKHSDPLDPLDSSSSERAVRAVARRSSSARGLE